MATIQTDNGKCGRRFGRAVAAANQQARLGDKADKALRPKSAPAAPRPAVHALQDRAAAFQEALDLVLEIKQQIQSDLMEQIDFARVAELSPQELRSQILALVRDILDDRHISCNGAEQDALVTRLLDDMVGLGPLEPLMADDSISDIMVNGAHRVFVERHGKIEALEPIFRDDTEVMNVALRIAAQSGRRIDETSPLVDARLADGSRVNIIVPPLAIDGPAISIRKFSRQALTLETMVDKGSLSGPMAALLMIAGTCRVNMLISGGTGSGKTTLLNAVSGAIGDTERIVTIEDAAELRLMQPHVVRLETRPASLEGKGQIAIRDLVRNALRMRPDRIIVGEVRGDEVVDMLQAMNTGHDGSLGTLHANSPRHALTRLENLFAMAGFNLPPRAVRTQIAEAIDLIVQTERMRDGVRRITAITEVVGMEDDVVLTQDLFTFELDAQGADGAVNGRYVRHEIQPRFAPKARYFGLEQELLDAILGGDEAAAA